MSQIEIYMNHNIANENTFE